jgi:hypothetical protein
MKHRQIPQFAEHGFHEKFLIILRGRVSEELLPVPGYCRSGRRKPDLPQRE